MTATQTAYRKLTQAELVAEATDRFGDDPLNWAFLCPSCGDTATGRDFRDALTEHPRDRKGRPVIASDLLGQECIGRTLGALSKKGYQGRGCDWAAYGLFCGPWEIVMPDGRSAWGFPLAPAPQPPAPTRQRRTTSPCPCCHRPKGQGKYLCPDCWSSLPTPARNALSRRDDRGRALARLRELHHQLDADVPLADIRITN